MKVFWWVRLEDETGMSGTGRVAQVAVFSDGTAVMRWLAQRTACNVGSTVVYSSLEELVRVHSHGRKSTYRLEEITTKNPEEITTKKPDRVLIGRIAQHAIDAYIDKAWTSGNQPALSAMFSTVDHFTEELDL